MPVTADQTAALSGTLADHVTALIVRHESAKTADATRNPGAPAA